MTPHFLTGGWAQRAISLGLMATIIYLLGFDLEDKHGWALYSLWAVTLVLEFLAFQRGMAMGIEIYRTLTPEQRLEINKIIDSE
jgi:hypothetical protein